MKDKKDRMEGSFEIFKNSIYRMTDIDLSCYKERQMKRRIDSYAENKGCGDYDGFIMFLRKDPDALASFVDYITINVSEFFRNPEQWEYLEKEVIPKFTSKSKVRIWSAACSTGDEPYTLAMLFLKYLPRIRFSITATDIDDLSLAAAREGIYSAKSIKGVPEEFMGCFTKTENDKYVIAPEIRKCVNFKKHNLLKDEFPRNMDLIVCRNVLIYFTEEKKEELFSQFHDSLGHGGVLFLGNTEQMMDYRKSGYSRLASFFYEKL